MKYVGNMIYDTSLKQNHAHFVIFGAGKFGKRIYEYLYINDLACNVSYFCDMDEKLWGGKINDIEIVNPKQLIVDKGKYHYLVGGNYANEMIKFLVENNIDEIHVLFA